MGSLQTNDSNKSSNPRFTSQTPAESREAAKAPLVDSLQAKREKAAREGRAHESMHGHQAVNPAEYSQAEVEGDAARALPSTEPGSANVTSNKDVPLTDSPSSEHTTDQVASGDQAIREHGSAAGEGAAVGTGEPSKSKVQPTQKGAKRVKGAGSKSQAGDKGAKSGNAQGSGQKGLSRMNREELEAVAKAEGVENVDKFGTVDELREAVKANRESK